MEQTLPGEQESRRINPLALSLISFVIPFLGFLLLAFGGGSVKAISFQNYVIHSILLLITSGLAVYTSYIAYKGYAKSKDARALVVALAFLVFGFVFFAHAISVPGWGMFSDAVFDVNEHYGLFFGSVILLGLIFPLSGWQEDIFKHKGKIIFAAAAFLVLSFIFLVSLAPLAGLLEEIVNIIIGATGLFFAVSLIFLIRQYRQKAHPLLFYLIVGLSVLVNSAIIPLFYTEWGLLWWYFHLTFLTGFAVILYGVLKTSSTESQMSNVNGQMSNVNGQMSNVNGQMSNVNGQMSNVNGQMPVSGFESVFGGVPFYSRIGAKLWLWAGTILAALVILGLVVWIQMGKLERSFKELSKESYEMHLVMAASLAISRTLMPPNDYLVAGGDTNEPANFEKLVRETEAVFLEMEPYAEKPREKSFIAGAKEDFTQIKLKSRRIFAMPRDHAGVSTESGRLMEEIDALGEKAITRIQEWDEISDAEIAEQEKNVAASQKIIVITIMFLLALAITITGVFGYLIIRSITGPFERLLVTVKKILQGDLSSRVEVVSSDEIGELSKSFNAMTDSLLKSNTDIRQKSEELEAQNEELETASAELEEAKIGLEEKVKQRTAELELAKTGLEQEVAQRTLELQKANEELNQQKAGLEQEVTKRTEDLQDKLLELERFNKIAVGRELKMVDLKKEIAKLKGGGAESPKI